MVGRLQPASLALGLALSFAVAPAALAKEELIFEIQDPRGDDHGNGNLTYPLRHEFAKGDFDIVAFRAFADDGGTLFEVELASKIRAPERGASDKGGTDLTQVARHGFYTFNLDLYIDKDHQAGSGGVQTLPGRHAEMADTNGWERAVVLTPRPSDVKTALRRMWLRELNDAMRAANDGPAADDRSGEEARAQQVRASLAEAVFFPMKIRARGNFVRFFVPDEFLGGRASKDWGYVLFITGADLVTSLDLGAYVGLSGNQGDNLMAIPVSPGSWNDRFGGGRDDAPNQPPIVDLLVPPGKSQEKILSEFTSTGTEPQAVKLPAVIPAGQ